MEHQAATCNHTHARVTRSREKAQPKTTDRVRSERTDRKNNAASSDTHPDEAPRLGVTCEAQTWRKDEWTHANANAQVGIEPTAKCASVEWKEDIGTNAELHAGVSCIGGSLSR